MKPLLLEQLRALPPEADRVRFMREFLQARILLSLEDHGAFSNWAFVGGTALRFLFATPRYSEDLDFSVVRPEEDSGFVARLRRVESRPARRHTLPHAPPGRRLGIPGSHSAPA